MCKVPEFWASTSSVESRGFRGTVAALTPSPHWAPCPTERRAVAYTYYTLDTWLMGKRIGAHGAARVPLHPRGPCAGGWPYAGTSAVRLLGDQSAATQVACAGPREAMQNTPYSEQNCPTSLFLPLSRPAFRRTPLRQTGGGHARMVLRRGLQFRNGATVRAGASRMSLMRTSRPDSRTQISWLCAGSPAATARGD